MFTNIFGKGIMKKVANFFWKGGVGPIDISKDANLLNSITPGRNSSEDGTPIKNLHSNNTSQDSKTFDKFPVYLDDNERNKEEIDLDKNKLYSQNSYNHVFSDFRNRIKGVQNKTNIVDRIINPEEELITNRLKNRVCEATITANMPREDRSNAIQLENFDGYFLSVLDGHGGDEVADFASKKLHRKFDMKYKDLLSEGMNEQERVKRAIVCAFEEIEREYYLKALEKYRSGEGKFGYVGSCVLCIVVRDNHLYVANLGDCKAKLFRRQTQKLKGKPHIFYEPIKLTTTHNASKFYEQKKLRQKFKDEDIIVEKGYTYYVKGRLQPTRSLGDFYMKYKEFNDPPKNMTERYARRAMDNFNGPYIENIPDVESYELNPNDEFLVLATDGLWDWLNAKEVADIIAETRQDKRRIAEALWTEALSKAASKVNLDLDKVLNLPGQIKRSIHDDISLLVVDLKNQVTYNK